MADIPMTYAMGAKDVGLEGALDNVQKSLNDINKGLQQQQQRYAKLSKGIDKAFSAGVWAVKAPFKAASAAIDMVERRVGQFNLASIAESMKSLTGDTGNLSNAMESAFASNAKAAKPMFAALGKTGKELRKLTSQASGMAYGMNVGIDTVTATMVTLESVGGPAKKALNALNMSTKEFVKFAEVSGMKAEDLADAMADLQTSWGATPEQAAATANAVLAIGQAAGVGADGLKGMNGLMEKYNAVLADAPPAMRLTGGEMTKMVESATKLAGAYREMGAPAEKAVELAYGTAEAFTKESVGFQKALEGRAEYTDFQKALMTNFNWLNTDVENFLATASKDPTKGMRMLNDAASKVSGGDLGSAGILMRQLFQTVQDTSPAMAWLAQNTNAGQDALKKFDEMTVKSTNSIKKFANEGFSTGLTLQEAFDRAKLGFDTMLRSIGRKEVKTYAKEAMGSYRTVGKEIIALGADKTWGPLMKNLSIAKQMGMRGVLMNLAGDKKARKGVSDSFVKMEALGDAIGIVSDTAAPLMQTLGKFGPLGTAAGAAATWFMLPKDSRDKLIESIKPVWKAVKEGAMKIWEGEDGPGTGLKATLIGAWKEFHTWLMGAWPPVWEMIKGYIRTGIKEIPGLLWSVFKEVASMVPTLLAELPSTIGTIPTVLLSVFAGAKFATSLVGILGPVFGSAMGGSGAGGMLSMLSVGGPIMLAIGGIAIALGAVALGIINSLDDALKADLATVEKIDLARQGRKTSDVNEKLNPFLGMQTTDLGQGRGDAVYKNLKGTKFEDVAGDTIAGAKGYRGGTTTGLKDWMEGDSEAQMLSKELLKQKFGGDAGVGLASADNLWSSLEEMKKMMKGAQEIPVFAKALQDVVRSDQGADFKAEQLYTILQQFKSQGGNTKEGRAKLDEKTKALFDFYGGDLGGAGFSVAGPAVSTTDAGDEGFAREFGLGAPGAGLTGPVKDELNTLPAVALTSATNTMTAMQDTLGSEEAYTSMQDVGINMAEGVTSTFAKDSPAEVGPLSGTTLFDSGWNMIEEMSFGVNAATEAQVLEIALTNALLLPLQNSYAAYEAEVDRLITQSTVMKKVGQQFLNLVGGGAAKIDLSTEEKKVLQASLDIPGMAGISGAIIADGNLTRKVLTEIAGYTKNMSEILTRGEGPSKGGVKLVTA